MGMYSTVIHPEDGRELQFKTGWDDLEVFKVGDKVEQYPLKYSPGHLKYQDGIYDSYSDKGDDDWVVISQGIIYLEPRVEDDSDDALQYPFASKYVFVEPARDLWPEWKWKEKEDREAKWKKENDEYMAQFSNLSPIEKLSKQLIRPLLNRFFYKEGLAEKIFKIEQITEEDVCKSTISNLAIEKIGKLMADQFIDFSKGSGITDRIINNKLITKKEE